MKIYLHPNGFYIIYLGDDFGSPQGLAIDTTAVLPLQGPLLLSLIHNLEEQAITPSIQDKLLSAIALNPNDTTTLVLHYLLKELVVAL